MQLSSSRVSFVSLFVELTMFVLLGCGCGNGWVVGQIYLDGIETEVRTGIWQLCFNLKYGSGFRCWYLSKFPEVNTVLIQTGRVLLCVSAGVVWTVICITFLHAFRTIKGLLLPQLLAKIVQSLMILVTCILVQAEYARDKYEDAMPGWACWCGWGAWIFSCVVVIIAAVNFGSFAPKHRLD